MTKVKKVKKTGEPKNNLGNILKERCANLGKDLSARYPRMSDEELDALDSVKTTTLEKSDEIANFIEDNKENGNLTDEVKELAAEKLLTRIFGSDPTYNVDKIAKELMEIMANLSTRGLIDRFMEYVTCPLLGNEKWDCGGMDKGNTEFCHSVNFMRCPSFAKYLAHQIVTRIKRKK